MATPIEKLMMNATDHPPTGLWMPHSLKYLYYGEGTVQSKLTNLLPGPESKAFIITGKSLATKTPLIKHVELLLGPRHHSGTYHEIRAHAPIADLRRAAELVGADPLTDTIISIGGGSPIDAAKWVSIEVREMRQTALGANFGDNEGYLTHITIPTTLSAAECTAYSAYTNDAGEKTVRGGHPLVGVTAILYDPYFASFTPSQLWLTTGFRALDHAVESMYHPSATELPCKAMCMQSVGLLFQYLPIAKDTHDGAGKCDSEATTKLLLAAFGSLFFLGRNMTSGLGLSHAIGYVLGVGYDVPHGETSCLTLGHVVKLKAKDKPEDAEQLARLLPYVTNTSSRLYQGDHSGDVDRAVLVGDAILNLVERLGLKRSLLHYGIEPDQIEIIATKALGAKIGGAVTGSGTNMYQQVTHLLQGLF